eukprot:scaffold602781_cov59-Attheya_sp.AAC.2
MEPPNGAPEFLSRVYLYMPRLVAMSEGRKGLICCPQSIPDEHFYTNKKKPLSFFATSGLVRSLTEIIYKVHMEPS